MTVRRQLIPVALESTDARKLRPLNAAEWTKQATEVEKQLAQEALFMGGYSANQAIELVDRAIDEAQGASDSVMAALNAVRQLIERPIDLPPGTALAEFLALRMKRVLQNLGRA